MKIKNVELYKTCFNNSQLPPENIKEIAFAGRSNVGKSTLLNTIFNRKIAKTSSKPGKTRSINYYLINQNYYFVDLPGYGYAKVSKEEKEKWQGLMENYFETRNTLEMVFLLLDYRHEPKESDELMISWLQHLNIPFALILTKEDKLKSKEKKINLEKIKSKISLYGYYNYFPVSAEKRKGFEQLMNFIGQVLGD